MFSNRLLIYAVCPGKKDQKFFVISSIKLGQFWWNVVYGFLNKFAAKSCKRFSPEYCLYATLCNFKCSLCPCYHWVVKETLEFISHGIWYTVASKFTGFESSWLKHLGNTAKIVYKTCIIYLDEPKQQLRTKQAKLDHVVITGAILQWHH